MPDRNNSIPVYFAGRHKYFVKGKKFYAPAVRIGNSYRWLRRSFRTASNAEEHGRRVVKRYQRLLAAAGQEQEHGTG